MNVKEKNSLNNSSNRDQSFYWEAQKYLASLMDCN